MSQNSLKWGIYNRIFSYRQAPAADSAASVCSTPTEQELPPHSPALGAHSPLTRCPPIGLSLS